MTNPLRDWHLDLASLTTTGRDLRRPECVLAEPDGTLWAADLRGGVLGIGPDGSQHILRPHSGGGPFAPEPFVPGSIPDGTEGISLPNGLAFDADGNFLIANFGTKKIEHLARDGSYRVVLDHMDGQSLGQTNFVLRDSRGRLWFTVTTRQDPWLRWVATECRTAGSESSKTARRAWWRTASSERTRSASIPRGVAVRGGDARQSDQPAEIATDGTVAQREVYGPEDLGGRPDGMTFDAYGNLWITLISHDRLVALTTEGDVLLLWEDGDPAAKAARDRAERSGTLTPS